MAWQPVKRGPGRRGRESQRESAALPEEPAGEVIDPGLIWLVVLVLAFLIGASLLFAALAVPFVLAVVKAVVVGWAARALLRRLDGKGRKGEPPAHTARRPRENNGPQRPRHPHRTEGNLD